jgi:sec-independent protein translocase protein TatA
MIGTTELMLIFGLIVLLFGANKLPELARSMGSSMGEFKKAQTESERNLRDFERNIKNPTVTDSEDLKKTKVQETAEKLGIDIQGKSDDQLLDEIQRAAERPKEVSHP